MDKPIRPKQNGFTLIELTIVIAILGLIASIAIPKVSDLIIKAQEGSVRGKLGALRSAINIYYADQEGSYPVYIEDSLPGFYIDDIPPLYIPAVKRSGNPGHFSQEVIETDEPISADTGGWVYFTPDTTIPPGTQRIRKGLGKKLGWSKEGGPGKIKYLHLSPFGQIYVDCIHLDSRGGIWSAY